MSVLSSVKPPMWPLSPELTEAPELWRGVVGVWALQEKTGPVFSCGLNTLRGDLLESVSWVNTSIGPGLVFDPGGNHVVDFGDPRELDVNEITVTIMFELGTTSNRKVLASKYNSSAGDFREWLFEQEDGSLNVFMSSDGTFSSSNLVTTPTLLVANQKYIASFKYKNDGQLKIYLDGGEVAEGSVDSGGLFNGTARFIFGAQSNGPTSTRAELDGYIIFVAIHKQPLSESKIVKLHSDPFAMLRPRSDL